MNCRHHLSWIATTGLLATTVLWSCFFPNGKPLTTETRRASGSVQDETGLAFQMEALESQRAEQNRSYLPFLNRATLSCGVYFLAAGSTDGQSPHTQDEVYYVKSGKAKLSVDGEDLDATPGAILFVAANAEHRFHSIEADLTLLVFFSKAAIEE